MSKRRLSHSITDFTKISTRRVVARSPIYDVPSELFENIIIPFVPFCYIFHLKRVNRYFYETIQKTVLKEQDAFERPQLFESTDAHVISWNFMSFYEHSAIIGFIKENDVYMLEPIWKNRHLRCKDLTNVAIIYGRIPVLEYFTRIGQEFPSDAFEESLRSNDETINWFMKFTTPKQQLIGEGLTVTKNFSMFKKLYRQGFISKNAVSNGTLLNHAAAHGDYDLAFWLVDQGSIIRRNFMSIAVKQKNAAMLQKLIVNVRLRPYNLEPILNDADVICQLFLDAISSNTDQTFFEFLLTFDSLTKNLLTPAMAQDVVQTTLNSLETDAKTVHYLASIFGDTLKKYASISFLGVIQKLENVLDIPTVSKNWDVIFQKFQALISLNIIQDVDQVNLENILISERFGFHTRCILRMFVNAKLIPSDNIDFYKSSIHILSPMFDEMRGEMLGDYDADEDEFFFEELGNRLIFVEENFKNVRNMIEFISYALETKSDHKTILELINFSSPSFFYEFVRFSNFLRMLWTGGDKFLKEINPEEYKTVTSKIFSIIPKFSINCLFGPEPHEHDDLTIIKEYYQNSPMSKQLCEELESRNFKIYKIIETLKEGTPPEHQDKANGYNFYFSEMYYKEFRMSACS